MRCQGCGHEVILPGARRRRTSRKGASGRRAGGGIDLSQSRFCETGTMKEDRLCDMDSDVLYRPPGEWKSYLLQCTIGCSYNKCTFCAMYKGASSSGSAGGGRSWEDIDMARDYYGPGLRRVFLMDGDAVIMKTEDLLRILHKLYRTFPSLEKVTTYAGPRSTLAKSPEELRGHRGGRIEPGLSGGGGGSDAVLKAINKGVTAAQMLEAGQKLVAPASTCGPSSSWASPARTGTGRSTSCPPPG